MITKLNIESTWKPCKNSLDDDDGTASSTLCTFTLPSSMAMSGTILTRSLRKSNRDSDIMHCFKCDGDNVLAFLDDVMLLDFESKLSTNNSSVREMITGTACAILPTSSSACIILLIRPWSDKQENSFWLNFFCWLVFTFDFKCLRGFLEIFNQLVACILTAGNLALYFRFFEGILMISLVLINIFWYLFQDAIQTGRKRGVQLNEFVSLSSFLWTQNLEISLKNLLIIHDHVLEQFNRCVTGWYAAWHLGEDWNRLVRIVNSLKLSTKN